MSQHVEDSVMATVCPYCNIEVSESSIEAEDGCCPECGSVISATSSFLGDDDSEFDEGPEEQDIFDDLDDDDDIFEAEEFDEEFDDDDLDEEFDDEEFDDDDKDKDDF